VKYPDIKNTLQQQLLKQKHMFSTVLYRFLFSFSKLNGRPISSRNLSTVRLILHAASFVVIVLTLLRIMSASGRSTDLALSMATVHFILAFIVAFLAIIGATASTFCEIAPISLASTLPICPSIERQSILEYDSISTQVSPHQHEKEIIPEVRMSRVKRNFLSKLFHRLRKRKQSSTSMMNPQNGNEHPNIVSSQKIELSLNEKSLIQELSQRVIKTYPDFLTRASKVSWGGPGGTSWWDADGTHLLHAYLQIMKWPPNLETKFPFRLCSKGCGAEVALAHSLRWREAYKPWCMSPATLHENRNGFVYLRGHAPSITGDASGNSLVWLRLSIQRPEDPIQWIRAIVNTLDRAVSDSLRRTNGMVGRFNCIIDADGAKFSQLAGIGVVKNLIVMLQDHFPDRLGMLVLTNLSLPAQFLLGIITPLLTKEVRDKVKVIPDASRSGQQMVKALIGSEFQPPFLGGSDSWTFSPHEYYNSPKHLCRDEESVDYLTSMPYHAY
jgi:CRAL/TRIO domain